FLIEPNQTGRTLIKTITPRRGAFGTASVVISVVKTSAPVQSASRRFTLSVEQANGAPMALPQFVSVLKGSPQPVALTSNNAGSRSLTYVSVTQPTQGMLSGTPPNLLYVPNPNTLGTDSFTFKVNDGKLDSA